MRSANAHVRIAGQDKTETTTSQRNHKQEYPFRSVKGLTPLRRRAISSRACEGHRKKTRWCDQGVHPLPARSRLERREIRFVLLFSSRKVEWC